MIKVIKKMDPSVEQLTNMFTDMECMDFILSPYVLTRRKENGLLIFATLSCALLFAENIFSEADLCETAEADEEARKLLLFNRVLIPRGSDEMLLCEQFRKLLLNVKKHQLHGCYSDFTIFTTTACNARCYYCFEHGYIPITMSEQTAVKTAEFIENHSADHVTLVWFGGEPLVNTTAIDIITEHLESHNVSFESRIVTNAYLFTPELIQRAKSQWKLISAQITLDGTAENYNRIKNYANDDPDAYSRVLSNIKALAENEIRVMLYLTLSRENEADLYALFSEIAPIIRKNPARFSVLPALLQQYGGAEDEDEMMQKRIRMEQWLAKNGLMEEPVLPQSLHVNSCTADNPGAVVIQADGGLNRCDHISECEPYGNIAGEKINQSLLRWWKERKEAINECTDCVLYPHCIRLSHCEANNFSCTNASRSHQIDMLVQAMDNYKDYDITTQ